MSDGEKRKRIKELAVLFSVLLANAVIVAILVQGFLTSD